MTKYRSYTWQGYPNNTELQELETYINKLMEEVRDTMVLIDNTNSSLTCCNKQRAKIGRLRIELKDNLLKYNHLIYGRYEKYD